MIEVIQADITTLEVDAVVNAANTTPFGGRPVDAKAGRDYKVPYERTLCGCWYELREIEVMKQDRMRNRIGRLLVGVAAAAMLLAGTANGELTRTTLTADAFSRVEYKILLKIDGLDARDPIETTLQKIAAALDMFDVKTEAKGPRWSAYVDAPGLNLKNANYILRLSGDPKQPQNSSGTLKLRCTDIKDVVRMEGKNLKPGTPEIDHPGKNVYCVAYSIRFKGDEDFPGGKVNGKTLMAAIEKRYPDLGEFLKPILGEASLVVPPFVERWSSSAVLKTGLKMGVDIFRFDDEVLAELSFTRSLDDKTAAGRYKDMLEMLKAKGLLADKQMTKTSSYLDYWFVRNADKLPKE